MSNEIQITFDENPIEIIFPDFEVALETIAIARIPVRLAIPPPARGASGLDACRNKRVETLFQCDSPVCVLCYAATNARIVCNTCRLSMPSCGTVDYAFF